MKMLLITLAYRVLSIYFQNELGAAIFEKIANVCYEMLDHEKSYKRFLAAMKLLHVPVHTPSIRIDVDEAAPSTILATGNVCIFRMINLKTLKNNYVCNTIIVQDLSQ